MSLRKLLLRFLSRPIHIHVKLPFHQTLYVKLSTALYYCGDNEYESPVTFVCRGLGAIVYPDGPRSINIDAEALLLSLSLGTFKRGDCGC